MSPFSLFGITAAVVVFSTAALGQTRMGAPPAVPSVVRGPSEPAQAPQPLPMPVAVSCDAGCIRGNAERAIQACAPRVEAEAPGDYDWLYRPYGSIFQEADSPEQPTSPVVRYRGDSVRFLSPQKEWVRAIYECGFDTAKQEVAYLKVKLGVLGKKSAVPVLPAPPPQARAPQPPAGQPNPAQAQAANSAAPTSDRRRVGEPDDVSLLQVKPSSKQR